MYCTSNFLIIFLVLDHSVWLEQLHRLRPLITSWQIHWGILLRVVLSSIRSKECARRQNWENKLGTLNSKSKDMHPLLKNMCWSSSWPGCSWHSIIFRVKTLQPCCKWYLSEAVKPQMKNGLMTRSTLSNSYLHQLYSDSERKMLVTVYTSDLKGIPHICHFFYTGKIFGEENLHRNLHSKLPIYTVNCQFFALNL